MYEYNPDDWVIKHNDTEDQQYQRLVNKLPMLLRVEETFKRIATEVKDERNSKDIEHH